jgi:hypothetical protein
VTRSCRTTPAMTNDRFLPFAFPAVASKRPLRLPVSVWCAVPASGVPRDLPGRILGAMESLGLHPSFRGGQTCLRNDSSEFGELDGV